MTAMTDFIIVSKNKQGAVSDCRHAWFFKRLVSDCGFVPFFDISATFVSDLSC